MVALSGVTDAYQPIERKLELTRRCVAVFAEFRNPITIITKNALVARDISYVTEEYVPERIAETKLWLD